LANRTQMRKSLGAGRLLFKSRKVLSVLHKLFAGGLYRQQFGIHASTADFV